MTEAYPFEKKEYPGQLAKEFITVSDYYIAQRKAWIQEEFGETDYGLRGVVVVGSAAAGKERPESDVDIFLVVDEGLGDTDDFVDAVSRIMNREVSLIGVVELAKGEQFEPEDWNTHRDESFEEDIARRGGRPYNPEYFYHQFE